VSASLWCMRHPPVAAEGLCYGQYDVPARIDPEEAASIALRALGGALGDARFDAVCTSPLSRTRGVAEAIARRMSLPLEIDARIAELSMGEWDGQLFADIERTDAARFTRWMAEWQSEAPPGGETILALQARVDAFLEDASASPHRALLAVTHAGVIRAIRARVMRISYEEALAAKVEHLLPERIDLPILRAT
jgi:alpha-ribazole phosphatase